MIMANKKAKKMTQKQLDYYKQLLLEKMQEILSDVCQMEESVFQGGGELSTMPVHLADVGTDSYEQEFSLGLMAEERKTLMEIQQALARIQNGTFGFCEGLGIPIEENRLEAIPWTRYSLEYAKMIESGKASKHDNFRRRPIDIQRDDDDIDDDDDAEEVDTEEVELIDEDIDQDEDVESLDDLQEEEDYDEDEDIDRQRNSA
jgi:RNA polymerase-binding protein DksA